MSGDILTVKTVKRVRSVRGSALVHISIVIVVRSVRVKVKVGTITTRDIIYSKFGNNGT